MGRSRPLVGDDCEPSVFGVITSHVCDATQLCFGDECSHRVDDDAAASTGLSGESNESSANTEACTLAGRGADRGGIDIKDGEGGCGG